MRDLEIEKGSLLRLKYYDLQIAATVTTLQMAHTLERRHGAP